MKALRTIECDEINQGTSKEEAEFLSKGKHRESEASIPRKETKCGRRNVILRTGIPKSAGGVDFWLVKKKEAEKEPEASIKERAN